MRSTDSPRIAFGWQVIGLFSIALAIYVGAKSLLSPNKAIEKRHDPIEIVESGSHSLFELPVSSGSTAETQITKLEPQVAGWTSEAVSAAIGKQLGRITELLKHSNDTTPSIWHDIAAKEFTGATVDDALLATTINDGHFQGLSLPQGFNQFGATDSLKRQIECLVSGPFNEKEIQCKFKVTNIELGEDTATVGLLVESSRTAAREQGMEQTNANCVSTWKLSDDEPKLQSLQIRELDRVSLAAAGRHLFEDITAAVLPNNSAAEEQVINQQVLRDTVHWSERLSKIDDMSIFGHHGIAVADINGDGLEDLYVCDSGGLPNRMYLQTTDGTLKDISQSSKTDWLESSSGVLLVDLDNDTDPDLVVATAAGIIIAENDGEGIFKIRIAMPGTSEAQSLAAADFDNDRNLDVYITMYGPGGTSDRSRGFESASPIPYHDANNGGANVLLRNNGAFQFSDVTKQTGLDTNNRRFSFAASWEDYDTDGDMDLYVANDFGRNNLYQNTNGRFRDVAAELGVEDMAGGMSVSWGDANQDGRMDIYVGNMYSAAGNRVTYQRKFIGSRNSESVAGIQRMARGNTLFTSHESGFADVSEAAGVSMGRWAWSSKFADINNDGSEDLLVANGYFTNTRPDDL